jgi:hypothetical protein
MFAKYLDNWQKIGCFNSNHFYLFTKNHIFKPPIFLTNTYLCEIQAPNMSNNFNAVGFWVGLISVGLLVIGLVAFGFLVAGLVSVGFSVVGLVVHGFCPSAFFPIAKISPESKTFLVAGLLLRPDGRHERRAGSALRGGVRIGQVRGRRHLRRHRPEAAHRLPERKKTSSEDPLILFNNATLYPSPILFISKKTVPLDRATPPGQLGVFKIVPQYPVRIRSHNPLRQYLFNKQGRYHFLAGHLLFFFNCHSIEFIQLCIIA